MNIPTAMILLDHAAAPDVALLSDALRDRHPGISLSRPPAAGKARMPESGRKSLALMCAGKILAVMSVSSPLPADPGVLARAAATWPTAAEAFRRSKAHLIVAIMGDSSEPLPVARVITAVTGGLIATVPGCLGVIWGSTVADAAERWLDLSKGAFAPYPHFPSLLWCSVHPFRDERTGGIGALTQGLSRFVGRELELTTSNPDVKPLMLRIHGLAAYLIEKGAVLKDGSTFGVSETERISVRLCQSERIPGLPVISGSLAAIEPPPPR